MDRLLTADNHKAMSCFRTGIRQALDAHRIRQLAADLGGCDRQTEAQRPPASGSLTRVA